MEVEYSLPVYKIVDEHKHSGTTYWVVGADHTSIPENLRACFDKEQEATHIDGDNKTIYLAFSKLKSTTVKGDVFLRIDHDLGDTEHEHYLGDVSDFLSSVHKFDRREQRTQVSTILIDKSSPKIHRAVNLAESKNRAR